MNNKIRLWDTENKVMIYPKVVPEVNHNGDYDKYGYEDFAFNLNGDLLIKDATDWSLTYRMATDEYAKRFIKMKSIWIQDKKEKEIYEGDIYKLNNDMIKIVWNIELSSYVGMCINRKVSYYYNISEEIEIIGNIYENLELLEK